MNSPEALVKGRDTIAEKWEGLTAKDRMQIIGFVCVIVICIVAGFFWFSNQKIQKVAEESEQYRKSLNYIADNQLLYQKNKVAKEAERQRLLSADAKISNKLTTMASSLGISDVNISPKDPKKVGDDSGVEETEVEIQIKSVDYNKLLEYLVQIHKLDMPIYMRHINLSRTSNNSSADTKMTASIVLISYRMKEPNA